MHNQNTIHVHIVQVFENTTQHSHTKLQTPASRCKGMSILLSAAPHQPRPLNTRDNFLQLFRFLFSYGICPALPSYFLPKLEDPSWPTGCSQVQAKRAFWDSLSSKDSKIGLLAAGWLLKTDGDAALGSNRISVSV